MQRKWTKWEWAELLLFAAPVTIACAIAASAMLLGILSMMIFGHHHGSRENARRASCQSNLKNIAFAMHQYAGDNDARLPAAISSTPPASARFFGWADALLPYGAKSESYQCISEISTNTTLPTAREYSDYYLNKRIEVFLHKSVRPQSTILFGEGNDGTDSTTARYSLSTLPARWRTDENSPAFRHLGGANYAFVDGHVKWLKPERVTADKPNGKNYTFTIN